MEYAKNKKITASRVETAVVAALVLSSAAFVDYAVRSSRGADLPIREEVGETVVAVEAAASDPEGLAAQGAEGFEGGHESGGPAASGLVSSEIEALVMDEPAAGGLEMPPEMRHALEVLERARERSAAASAPQPDEEFFRRAAAEIGYVPATGSRENGVSLAPLVTADPSNRISGGIHFQSGDLAAVGAVRIKLKGVRAPAPQDLCETAAGDAFDCVEWSRRGMETIVAGRSVDCDPDGSDAGGAGVVLASCSLTLNNGSQRDLAEIGVEAGLLAPGGDAASRYRAAEMKARDAGNGLWSGVYQTEENGEK